LSTKPLRAFEQYYSLTKTGILPSVAVTTIANDLDVSTRTVYEWKKKGQWDKRATERSMKANEELAQEIKEEADNAVKDQRRPYIKILNGLIGKCMRAGEIQINNVKDLIAVMTLSVQLQKELDMQDVHIISAEYSPDKHIKAINDVLAKVKERDDKALKKEFGDLENGKGGLHKAKILDPRQTDIRADSSG
jgi:hypothetical protein